MHCEFQLDENFFYVGGSDLNLKNYKNEKNFN